MVVLGQLAQTKDIWQKLLPCRFPPVTAYDLAEFMERVDASLRRVETVRVEAIKAHGKQTDAGWSVEPESDEGKAFMAEMDELYRQEIDFRPFPTPLRDLLKTAKAGDLSVEECLALRPFFGEKTED